jgi:hypothetical protein
MHGDRGVDCIASPPQHLGTNLTRHAIGRGHHALGAVRRLHTAGGKRPAVTERAVGGRWPIDRARECGGKCR